MIYIMSARSLLARCAILVALILSLGTSLVLAQTTVSTGSIQGTITDPSGAVVAGAKITISNKSTGRVISIHRNFVRHLHFRSAHSG